MIQKSKSSWFKAANFRKRMKAARLRTQTEIDPEKKKRISLELLIGESIRTLDTSVGMLTVPAKSNDQVDAAMTKIAEVSFKLGQINL